MSVKIDIAEDHLKEVLNDVSLHGVIMEWGSGGSTRWFGENMRREQTLYSVEHDKEWWHKVIPEVAGFGNVHLWLYEPKYPFPRETYGTPHRENPVGCEAYISGDPVRGVLEAADVVFVDGICRSACLATAAQNCLSGTVVYLHDAPPRDWYKYPYHMFRDYEVLPPAEGHRHGMTRFVV